MQEMVGALKRVLKHPDGVALATSSRMKPIYAALVAMADLNVASGSSGGGGSAADQPRQSELTKAKSVVDLLIEHSDVPANASYDDLIMQAQASYRFYEANGGSDCDECLLSPNQLSTASPNAHEPGSSAVSSRADSVRRLSFTPTANLDCSPAHCSPLSRFNFEAFDSSTPSALSRHPFTPNTPMRGSTPSASALAREGSSPMLSTAQTSPAAETPSAAGTPHWRVTSPLAREAHLPPLHSQGGVAASPVHTHLRVRTRMHDGDAAMACAGQRTPGAQRTPGGGRTPGGQRTPGWRGAPPRPPTGGSRQ